MQAILSFTIIGIVTGAIYAVAASGLVLTYTTSGIFNFAHGGIGMFMAFVYWELRFNHGWPAPIALLLVVGVFAPLMGAAIERTLMRNLGGSNTGTALVVTIGLMVLLIGLAQALWPPSPRQFDLFFGQSGFNFGEIFILWHQVLTVVVAAAVAGAFWWLLNRTRTGVAMRAVVDDRGLAGLAGASPARLSMLSWALGSSLAAVAGILIAPILNLQIFQLTLLVVVAYAAAVVGRLQSLPLTFAGAMLLGLLQAYTELLPTDRILGLRGSIPTLLLFAVLVLMPEDKLRAGRLTGAKAPRVPTFRESVQGAAVFLAAAVVVSMLLSSSNLVRVGQALALSIIMLSLVVLTGYGGQVSLAQMTFVGVGAFAMAQFGAGGNPLGLLMAALIAAPIGAIVALPALRLQGLYLALATMAFGVLAENMFFPQSFIFGSRTRAVPRLDALGLSFAGEQAFFILIAAAFAAFGVFTLWLRRGRFGRLLSAMRDSPTACAMLGLNLTATKLAVFTLSAAMAGLAGALFGGLRGTAQTNDFLMFQSLPLLLMAVIGGITTVSGALIGGLILGLLPVLQEEVPALGGLVFLVTGAAAISLGRNPHGIAFWIGEWTNRTFPRRSAGPGAGEPSRDVEEVAQVAAAAR